MSFEEIQARLGSDVKVLPVPEQVNAKRQLAAVYPNEWRVERINDRHVELKNTQSGHTIMLPFTYIREFHSNELLIRFKIVLKSKLTIF